MATSNPVSHLCGLAKRLVSDGLLAEDLANEVQEKALKEREPFVSYLVSNNLLDSVSIASSASRYSILAPWILTVLPFHWSMKN